MPTQNFKVGEMLNKRTRNSKTWLNFDGSFTTEIHMGDVHYADENGHFQNINTDLFDEADFDQIDFPVAKDRDSLFYEAREKVKEDKKKNRLDRERFDFQGLQVPFNCKIPRNIKRGYSIGKGKSKLKFIPVGTSTSKGYVEGNKITYQDVWNDADLILEVLPNGIKETIILKSERAPIEFSFEVEGELSDELKIQPPWLQDANGEKRDVLQGVNEVDGKTVLSLAADVSGLVYPIAIDPTVTIQPDATAGKDAALFGGNTTGNYGTNTWLYVGCGPSTNETWRSLIQFDLSAIPSGAIITGSSFSLFQYSQDNTAIYNISLREVTASWIETTVTWANQPSFNPVAISTQPTNNGALVTFPVTSIVSDWVNGGKTNNGFMLLKDGAEGVTGSRKYFYSSDYTTEYTQRPKLIVTYNQPPNAPTVTAPNGGETWNSQHTVEWQEATDAINETTVLSTGATGATTNQSLKINGQSFKVTTTDFLYKVGLYVNATVSNPVKVGTVINLRNFNDASKAKGTIIATTTIEAQITTAGYVYFDLPTPQAFALNTFLCIEIVGPNNGSLGFSLQGSASSVYSDGVNFWTDSSSVSSYATYDLDLKAHYGTFSALQYQIQLSTDNGANWSDIVALTTAGATSYAFDFINKPETSTAKIRVRAYDGSAYGPWDESNGVFTIQHNQAPTVPTNLSPSGVVKDRAQVNRLSWQHNDANADPQAKFDLQWRLQGASTWNTVSQTTVNQYWDATANTFPKGVIEWQVRTYDQAGLSSPYSNPVTFTAGDKPANPTITSPTEGSTVAVANPTVQWSSLGQTEYHLKVLNTANTLLWESKKTSTNKAETILYNLQNSTSYKVQLAIKNADGLWSDFVTVNISVSYTPPPKPTVTTSTIDGAITLQITNPVPTGTMPTLSYNDLFKRKQGEQEWTRVASNLSVNRSFKDYAVASGQVYEYKVNAWGSNGTYSESTVANNSVTLTGVWLHDVMDPSGTINQFTADGQGRGRSRAKKAELMEFAGRRRPVTEYGDLLEARVSVTLELWDGTQDYIMLQQIFESYNTICYRDGRGRILFGSIFNLGEDDQFNRVVCDVEVIENDYTEEV